MVAGPFGHETGHVVHAQRMTNPVTPTSKFRRASLIFVLYTTTLDCKDKETFRTQDRTQDFEDGQVEATFWRGHCDLTSGTVSKILVLNERYG